MKRVVCVLLMLILIALSLVGCSDEAMTFSHCELSLVTDGGFEERESADYDLLLSNGEIAIGVLRLSFLAALDLGISDTYTAKGFAAFRMHETKKSDEIKMHADVPYFTYTEERENGDYYYTVAYFRSMYAYFEVAFASAYNDEATNSEILKIIEEIYFNDAPEIK